MKKLLSIYLFTAIICITQNLAYSQNRIIVNPGFEYDQNNNPLTFTDWTNLESQSATNPQIAGWYTTHPAEGGFESPIEVWRSGFLDVIAPENNYLAELNAFTASRLYQIVYLLNGENINWQYYHKRRSTSGTETARFSLYSEDGSSFLHQIDLSDANTNNWNFRSGSYTHTLPSGIYQISFEAIYPVASSFGNLLDDIRISLSPIVEIGQPNYEFYEGSSDAIYLYINGNIDEEISEINLAVTGGTATQGVDYNFDNLTINIPRGAYALADSIAIPLNLFYDGIIEGVETIQLQILNADDPIDLGDSDGNGVNIQNTTITILPKDKTAIDLDGINDVLKIPYYAGMNPDNFSLEAWLYTSSDGINKSPISSRDIDGNFSGWAIFINSENVWELCIGTGSDWEVIQGPSLIPNEWSHIAFTYDLSVQTANFYINGKPELTATNITMSKNIRKPFRIGSADSGVGINYTDDFFFAGKIDEVRLWSKALSHEDIINNMCREIVNPGTETDLTAYYDLNEGYGTFVNDLKASLYNGALYNTDGDEWINNATFTTWKGIESNEWTNPDNWSSGLPDVNTSIGICNESIYNAIISSDITTKRMVVCNGAQLIIDNPAKLSINEDLFINGTIIINPDNTGSGTPGQLTIFKNLYIQQNGMLEIKTSLNNNARGSLITCGTITGNGSIKIEQFISSDHRWQYISSPIDNAQSSLFTNHSSYGGYFNPNFLKYNETFDGNDPENADYSNWDDFSDAWLHAHNNDSGTLPVTLNSSKGYAFYNTADIIVNFTSTANHLNTGDKTINISYTDNDDGGGFGNYYDGWNLIGNPYPSALDWNNPNWNKTFIDNTIYYWNGSNYIYYNGTPLQGIGQTLNYNSNGQYIPAGQAFFIHAKSEAGAEQILNINNDSRIHSSNNLIKSNSNTPEFQFVKLEIEFSEKTDQHIIRFIDDATENFDGDYDAFKLFPYSDLPQIYSISEEKYPLAINSLNSFIQPKNKIIDLAFIAKTAGEYKISPVNMNLLDNTHVFLIDKTKKIELSTDNFYAFFSEEGIFEERFKIVFENNSTDIENKLSENNIQIYSTGKNIKINFLNNSFENSEYSVYHIDGRLIKQGILNSEFNNINIQNTSIGVYFVLISNKTVQYRKKININ